MGGGDSDKELKELLESLREVVLELRSMLLESRNPLRKVMVDEGEGNDGEKGGEEELAPVSASPRIFTPNIPLSSSYPRLSQATSPGSSENSSSHTPKPQKAIETPGDNSGSESEASREDMEGHPFEADSFERFGSVYEATVKNISKPGGVGGHPSIADLVDVAKTLWNLGESMPPEVLEKIIDLLEASGQLDGRRREVVRKYIDLMREARKLGLTPEEQIIAVYSIARSLGVRDEEFEKEVFRLVVRLLGGRRWENQQ
ncbi:hypothetical protein [Aeropyrum camini]|uniref:Uncharacterized protein n=2 Tax=Aeropyrum camini TaxID=229980 RepID=U3TAX9_9CREN|nr:hypothetical protein [Aeropyrum camini]BAN90667.1 hypothetical protein ACAM_1198 [Aeropyrum camini SY1 = JCM 12091]